MHPERSLQEILTQISNPWYLRERQVPNPILQLLFSQLLLKQNFSHQIDAGWVKFYINIPTLLSTIWLCLCVHNLMVFLLLHHVLLRLEIHKLRILIMLFGFCQDQLIQHAIMPFVIRRLSPQLPPPNLNGTLSAPSMQIQQPPHYSSMAFHNQQQ